MQISRFSTAQTLYERAESFLLAREAEHNLILGLLADLSRDASHYSAQAPYFAAVEEGTKVVAVALMTPPHNLVLSHVAASAALPLLVDDLVAAGVAVPGVTGAQPGSTLFAAAWRAQTGQLSRLAMAMRIYQLSAVQPVSKVPGTLRRATASDRDVLLAWIAAFHQEAEPGEPLGDVAPMVDRRLHSTIGGFYLWDDGQPVALAGCGGPTPNGIRIGPVYTPHALRRRGYASACVAQLSQLLLDQGRTFCFLFTDLGNPTSNHVYQALGYMPVSDVDMLLFAQP